MTDYFKFIKEIKTQCLYCKNTHSDPEYGYICCLNLKDYFYDGAYACPKHRLDVDFVTGEINFRIKRSNNSLEKRCYQHLAKKINKENFNV